MLIVGEIKRKNGCGVLFEEKVREMRFVKCRCRFLSVASRYDGPSRRRGVRIDKMKDQGELQNLRNKPHETGVAASTRFRY